MGGKLHDLGGLAIAEASLVVETVATVAIPVPKKLQWETGHAGEMAGD